MLDRYPEVEEEHPLKTKTQEVADFVRHNWRKAVIPGVAAVGLYGLHKYASHQKREIGELSQIADGDDPPDEPADDEPPNGPPADPFPARKWGSVWKWFVVVAFLILALIVALVFFFCFGAQPPVQRYSLMVL